MILYRIKNELRRYWRSQDKKKLALMLITLTVLVSAFFIFLIKISIVDPVNSYQISLQDIKIEKDSSGFKEFEDEKIISRKGIDVSEHQGDIDWEAVRDTGIEFAFLRCGYRGSENGGIYEDDYFRANAENAADEGIKIGLYFFSQAISVEEAKEEAKFTLKLAKKYNVSYPIAFDMEPVDKNGRINQIGAETKTDVAKAFCDEIKKAGYAPCIYGNMHWFYTRVNTEDLKDYPLWYANYSDDQSFEHNIICWQYSEGGKVDGISGKADLNIFFERK